MEQDISFLIGRLPHPTLQHMKSFEQIRSLKRRQSANEEQRSPVMATKAWAAAATLNPRPLSASPPSSPVQLVVPAQRTTTRGHCLRSRGQRPAKFVCRRAKNAGFDDYKFPDPIPEFAEQETSKFREHMAWRLEQKEEDYFGEHVEEIVDICTEILGSFLERDYCGLARSWFTLSWT